MDCYRLVYWDISGVCNGRCPYCPSGSKSILGNTHKKQSSFLSPEDLEAGLKFMIEKGVIHPSKTQIDLYNWGEPFLHPRFELMLQIVSNLGFTISLISNGSVLKMIPPNAYWRLRFLSFSMSGFSQASYDKVHGFDFNTVIKNIEAIVSPIRLASPGTGVWIHYHLYNFNLSEVEAAKEWCRKINIGFHAYPATTCSITSYLYAPFNKNVEIDLLASRFDQGLIPRPEGWQCPQYDYLVLDEYSNILQCIATDRLTSGHIVGSLREVNFDKLRGIRSSAAVCLLCHSLKIAENSHPL